MFVKLENGGRLRLPPSVVEALSLREGALLDCRIHQRTVLLSPARTRNAEDFSPQ